MRGEGLIAPAGTLKNKVITNPFMSGRQLTNDEILRVAAPQLELPDEVNNWREENRPALMNQVQTIGYARDVARKHGLVYLWSQLWLRVKRAGSDEFLPYGLAGCKVVTDTGVEFIVDGFQNIVEIEIMKFHGIGTGVTAEAASQTALVTELTTQYIVDNTRATGTTAEGATGEIFQTVGTNTVDAASQLIREHGVFTLAAVASGVMLDRTLFALITLESGDSLESTYELTFASGG